MNLWNISFQDLNCRHLWMRILQFKMYSSMLLLLVTTACFVVSTRAHKVELHKYRISEKKEAVNRIVDYVLQGAGRYGTYNKTASMCDTFGPRLSGSQALEDTADYLLQKLQDEGFDNVHAEKVMVPRWVRGEESVSVLEPRNLSLSVLGVGGTVGTNGTVLEGEAIVVSSFEELHQRSSEVPGKIVVFNQDYIHYFSSVKYRLSGASAASQYGAKAALIRSITDYSINSPHTGMQYYWPNVTKIPSLCLTVEDAELMHRWHKAGKRITLRISSTSYNDHFVESKNIIAEITGSTFPEQTVVFGGHLDSWDVGSGVMDDGAEVVLAWQVLSILKALDLKPKRTMRMVAWTAEEVGLQGANAYYQKHIEEHNRTSLMMETDYGLFTPNVIRFKGSKEAMSVIQSISNLLGPHKVPVEPAIQRVSIGADIGKWLQHGVPGLALETDQTRYFHYHHSQGDSLSVYTPEVLDHCTVIWTTIAYVVADLEDMLPRTTGEGFYHIDEAMGIVNRGVGNCCEEFYVVGLLLVVLLVS